MYHAQPDGGFARFSMFLVVLAQPPEVAEPREGPFDYPATFQQYERVFPAGLRMLKNFFAMCILHSFLDYLSRMTDLKVLPQRTIIHLTVRVD